MIYIYKTTNEAILDIKKEKNKFKKLEFNKWTIMGKNSFIDKFNNYINKKQVKIDIINIINKLNQNIDYSCKNNPEKLIYYYQDIIYNFYDLFTVKNILKIFRKLGVNCQINIYCSDKNNYNIMKNNINFEANFIFIKSKNKMINKLKKITYHFLRSIIGLFRFIKLFFSKKEYSLFLMRDRYVNIGGENGTLILTPILNKIKKENIDTLKISYPSLTTKPSLKKLKKFIKDKNSISYEFFYGLEKIINLTKNDFENNRNRILLFLEENFDIKTEGLNYDTNLIYISKEVAKLIFDLFNIKDIFTIGEYSKGIQSIIYEAQKRNVKVLAFQHGIIHKRHPGYNLPKSCFNDYKPDYFFTHGKSYTKLLKEIDYNNKRTQILTFGNPHFSKNKIKSQKKNKNILVVSQHLHKNQLKNSLIGQNIETKILDFLRNNIKLTIKLHPKWEENDKFYRNIEYPFEQVSIIHDEKDIYSLIAKSDLVISYTSTSLLESLAFQKPILELNDFSNLFSIKENFSIIKNSELIKKISPDDILSSIYDFYNEELCISNDIDYSEEFFSEPNYKIVFDFLKKK